MKRLYRSFACLTAAATLLSGCSMLTAQGRQERAYSRYVHKMSAGRAKQQKRFFSKEKNTMPVMQPTEPAITSEASGPESLGDGSGDASGQ
ncbi:MAG: hypothetical protein ABI674_05780 [Spartobacteria bacterium]